MIKVLFTKPFFSADIAYIKKHIPGDVELISPADYTSEEIAKVSGDVDMLFGGLITEEILEASRKLKCIQVPWTGVDKLNFSLLKKYKATVCNSHSNSGVVAEHAVALLFDAAKKLSFHDRYMRQGIWNRPSTTNTSSITPFSKKISNSNIGIVGFGNIGKDIHQMLSGFNCNFKVFNRSLKKLTLTKTTFYKSSDILKELGTLDFLFISVALTEQTTEMVNASYFNAMKNDAILINISRGEVIDQTALFNALINKDIAFAGIDTWYQYPNKETPVTFPSKENQFETLDNIIMSPHRAGMVDGSFPHLDDAIENINRLYTNKPLINKVSLTNYY